MKKVLITGGAGFIGYPLAKYLADKGNEVTILDNLSRGKMDKELQQLIKRKNVCFLNTDLTKNDFYRKFELLKNIKKRAKILKLDPLFLPPGGCSFISCIGENYDQVYHLAAINGTKYFYEKPEEVLKTNVLTTINILDWFVRSKSKKILFASSSEVYASNKKVFDLDIPTSEEITLCIEDIKNPRWSYAASKIIGEMLFINYARKYNFDYSIVRYHNVYGPRMGYSHVIPEFLTRICNKVEPFPIFGNDTRAFCYIEDAVKATELVMRKKVCNGEIINIGDSSEEISMVNLARTMFKVLNYDYQGAFNLQPSPKGSVERRCPNVNKLKNLTGWKPKITLKEGIELTHKYYNKQRRS